MRTSRTSSLVESTVWRETLLRLLRPVLRNLLRSGWRYRELADVLKESVVRTILEEDRAADDETIAARTGLGTRTVHRFRSRTHVSTPLLSYEKATSLLGRWTASTDYSEDGRPRNLPLHGRHSFATLAEMVGLDAEVALRELVRLGVVRLRRGRACITGNAYVPAMGTVEKLDIIGRDGAEFLGTMLHNLDAPPRRPMFQRKASYDNIGSQALAALREVLHGQAWGVLNAADDALAAADRDRNPGTSRGRRTRVTFGVYVSEEPLPPTSRGRQGKEPA